MTFEYIIVRLLIAIVILGIILGWMILTGWATDDGRVNRRVQRKKEDDGRIKDRSFLRWREKVQEEG